MWKNIPQEHKRRYSIILFIALPICFLISYFLSIKILMLLNYQLDSKGLTFIAFGFVPLYIVSTIVAYRKLKNKNGDNRLDP
jgi:pilus assembly protein TadC